MIVWPNEAKLNPASREGLRRIQETGAFAELESSEERWEIIEWPWTRETPLRVQLENQAHDAVDITLDEEGVWRLEHEPRRVRQRTAEEEELEAEGAVLGIVSADQFSERPYKRPV